MDLVVPWTQSFLVACLLPLLVSVSIAASGFRFYCRFYCHF